MKSQGAEPLEIINRIRGQETINEFHNVLKVIANSMAAPLFLLFWIADIIYVPELKWEFLDLLAIYDLALEHDPKLREALATRNAALENKPQSLTRLMPTLTMSGNLSRNSVLSKFDTGFQTFIAGARNVGFWSSSASINLTQPVYHHDLWVELSQADNRVAQAEANYAAEHQNLIIL